MVHVVLVLMPSSLDDEVSHGCPKNRQEDGSTGKGISVRWGAKCDRGCGFQVPPVSREYPDGFRKMEIGQDVLDGLAPDKRAKIKVLPDPRDERIAALEAQVRELKSKKKR